MKNIDPSTCSGITHPKFQKGFAQANQEQHIATEWKQHRAKQKQESCKEAATLASSLALLSVAWPSHSSAPPKESSSVAGDCPAIGPGQGRERVRLFLIVFMVLWSARFLGDRF